MKSRYTRLLLSGLLLLPFLTRAQSGSDVLPDRPVLMNGLEYGYTIRNESRKEVGSKGTFGRYEVTLYVTNKSGCSKLMMPRQTFAGIRYQELLADFDCLNATGVRLTSKGGSIRAREFSVPYTTSTKGPDGKIVNTTTQIRIGNRLRNGESVTQSLVFMVPDGEVPALRVRIQDIDDL